MVVVFTSNLSDANSSIPASLLDIFIIPAAKSSTPLPPNNYGVESLENWIQEVALPREDPEPVPPMPEIARRVSGQTYLLDSNLLGWTSVSLTFQEEAEALLNLTISPGAVPEYIVDPLFQSQMEFPVGLDNVYRFAPYVFGINVGLKGEWLSDDDFVIEYDLIGNTGQGRVQLSFDGDQVTLQIWENKQPLATIDGRLEG